MGRKKRSVLSPDRVLEELAAIGFAKVTDCLSIQGDELLLRDTENLTGPQAAAIASIERTNSGIRLKFYDKLKALELLGKHMRLFEGENRTDTGESNLLDAIVRATKEVMDGDDLPEIQQATDSGDDLVESAGLQEV